MCHVRTLTVVRLWRERKRRSKLAALNIVNGNGSAQPSNLLSPVNGNNGATGRYGSKVRREIDAQSSNVARILSRRMIGEVPALKFFDEGEPLTFDQHTSEPALVSPAVMRARPFETQDEGDPSSPISSKPQTRTIGDLMTPSSSLKGGALRTSPTRRATPRGVCYTLDTSGCRRIKMQSDAPVRISRAGAHTSQNHKKSEVVTVEKATSKTLRRKYVLVPLQAWFATTNCS